MPRSGSAGRSSSRWVRMATCPALAQFGAHARPSLRRSGACCRNAMWWSRTAAQAHARLLPTAAASGPCHRRRITFAMRALSPGAGAGSSVELGDQSVEAVSRSCRSCVGWRDERGFGRPGRWLPCPMQRRAACWSAGIRAHLWYRARRTAFSRQGLSAFGSSPPADERPHLAGNRHGLCLRR